MRIHVSSWGLRQSRLLVQYKQDFYRHVYEQVVVVPRFRTGWAELVCLELGRGGRQGLMAGGTAQPCLGVWVIYHGLCSLWFQLRLLFHVGSPTGGH